MPWLSMANMASDSGNMGLYMSLTMHALANCNTSDLQRKIEKFIEAIPIDDFAYPGLSATLLEG